VRANSFKDTAPCIVDGKKSCRDMLQSATVMLLCYTRLNTSSAELVVPASLALQPLRRVRA
jgi:hypothetical protein